MTKQEFKHECLEKLNLFTTLEKDWNGYNADPFDPILIEKCKSLINRLDFIPEIFPAADDSIQFEFSRFDGAELLFFIHIDKIEGLYVEPNRDKHTIGFRNDTEKNIENITEDDMTKEIYKFYQCNN